MRLGVSGHRPGRLGGPSDEVFEGLVTLAGNWLQSNTDIEVVHIGMAMGWDLAVAKACWQLQLPYCAHLPFASQGAAWEVNWRFRWASLVDAAKDVIVYHTEYTTQAFYDRNVGIVSNSDEMLVMYNGEEVGGTAHTVKTARGKPIHNLWSQWNG